jgi:catechol-2,3-dioxygenase
MPVVSFSHYNLRAPRAVLEELRAFYTDVIGLTEGKRPPFASFGYWLYAGDEPLLHLSEGRPGGEPPGAGASTFDHAAFRCSGREAFERHLTARGVRYEMDRVPFSRQVQLFLTDPAGNGVELNFEESD